MIKTIKVINGRIHEYENGSEKRSYGMNISNACTNGNMVAAITNTGRIEHYINGSLKRSYGTVTGYPTGIQISGDIVVITHSNQRIEEYKNGNMVKSY